MFCIAYAFKGRAHVFVGRVKAVSHSSCRTSAILKYFCPLPSIVIGQIIKSLESGTTADDNKIMKCFPACKKLTLKTPITTAADDKFCDIFPNF